MTETMQYIEEPWTIIKSYFKDHHLDRLVRHQIESYNNFVNYQLVRTIEMFNPYVIKSEDDFNATTGKYFLEIHINFRNFHIHRPQIHENNGATKLMFPQQARSRNFTYSSAMMVDLHIDYIINESDNESVLTRVLPNIHIGKLPIMLKSDICVLNQYKYVNPADIGECKYDTGGYFIINGSEKTVLGQERAAENRICCYNVFKNDPKYTWKAEIKSIPDFKCISPKQLNMMIVSKDNGFGFPIVLQIPRVKQPIPLFIVFRAIGVISDKEICEYILLNLDDDKSELLGALQASIIDANEHLTQEDALRYISSYVGYVCPQQQFQQEPALRKRQFMMDILSNDLFPHCQTATQKKYFLGYMAHRLLLCLEADERDSYINKRIDLTGTSLNNLFRNYFNKLVKDMEKQVIKEINTGSWRSSEDYLNIINMTNIYKIIKSTTIENGFKRALSTGDFSIKTANSAKVGVAQVLNRLTYIATLSHLRRISTPLDKSGKLVPPRKLHGSSIGYLCPAETPEGGSVGIVKNMAYMSHITINSNSVSLYDYVYPHIVRLDNCVSPRDTYNIAKVFINGAWVGVTDNAHNLYLMLKNMKYSGKINIYTSIVFNYATKEIRVCNDGGRILRPLLRVKDGKLLITPEMIKAVQDGYLGWDDLLTNIRIKESVIEYIDPEEQSFSLIATVPADLAKHPLNKYTHCEIHPSTMFGVTASCIPYPDHNQSPRNTYQCAQAKQAMGIYALNSRDRFDKTGYELGCPMCPLVFTRLNEMLCLNEIPAGCNAIVAIASYTGYNQEDSLMMNKGSIERGMHQTTVTHTEKDEDKQKINGDEEIRGKPDASKTKGMKFGNYDKVNLKGVIPENTLVENRDVIIAKVTPIKENRNDNTKVIKYEDGSKLYRTTEETYIDRNYIDRNGDGYNFAKVKVRTFRRPVIGDKFSSRHGQKGTVGNIIPEEDMPFTASGIRPDIIINPHAIPSRMTIGHLLETQIGKLLTSLGLFGDGTSFNNLSVTRVSELLLDNGFEARGNELMYDPQTGQQIESAIFIGPVFYQRLKHMVADKQHSRASGPMVNLTRQPAEGRSRDGGLRFGEMERDCMVSHGALRFTRGRMYDSSDKYSVYVCKKCGLIASYNDKMHIHCCLTCDNRSDFAYVEIPYSCKLLFQELTTMNVVPRLLTE